MLKENLDAYIKEIKKHVKINETAIFKKKSKESETFNIQINEIEEYTINEIEEDSISEREKDKINEEEKIIKLKKKLSFIKEKNFKEYNLLIEKISVIPSKEINYLIKIIGTINGYEDKDGKIAGNEYLQEDLYKYIKLIKLIFETNEYHILDENVVESKLKIIETINGYTNKDGKTEGNEYLKKDLDNYIKLIKLILNQINEYHILDENVVEAKLRIIRTINGYEDNNMKTEGNEFLKQNIPEYIELIKSIFENSKSVDTKNFYQISQILLRINGFKLKNGKFESTNETKVNIFFKKNIPAYIKLITIILNESKNFTLNVEKESIGILLCIIDAINGYESKNIKTEGNKYFEENVDKYMELIVCILNLINKNNRLNDHNTLTNIIVGINGYENINAYKYIKTTKGNDYLKKDLDKYIELIKLLIEKNLNREKCEWILNFIYIINGYEDEDKEIEGNECLKKNIPEYMELIKFLINVIELDNSHENLNKIKEKIIILNGYTDKKNNVIVTGNEYLKNNPNGYINEIKTYFNNNIDLNNP